MVVVSMLLAAVGFVLVALVSALLLLVFGLPLLLIPRGKRERYAIWTNVVVAWLILRVVTASRIHVEGREHILFGRSYLVVANHRSWLDIPLVLVTARCQGIAKLLVLFMPFMGQLGYLGGAVFFHRFRHRARQRALVQSMLQLKQGNPMHVYPEGTRSRDGELRSRVQLGMVRACWGEGVPCIPAVILGTEKALPVKRIRLNLFQHIYIRYLPPVMPEDYESAEVFGKAVWNAVSSEFEKMRQEVAVGNQGKAN